MALWIWHSIDAWRYSGRHRVHVWWIWCTWENGGHLSSAVIRRTLAIIVPCFVLIQLTWRHKILQFKERHLVVMGQNVVQSLRGSWGSRTLSLMSLEHTYVEICNTSCFQKNGRKLLFNNLSILWKGQNSFDSFFVRRVHRYCVQSFMEIGEVAWEERKSRFATFCQFAKKKRVHRNGHGLHNKIQHNWVNALI